MKPQPYRNPKLLALAKDAPCAVCGRYGTTVSAHANWAWAGKGMGRKADDSYISFLCHAHHMELDQGKTMTKEEKENMWLMAMAKTYHYLLSNNLLVVNPINPHIQYSEFQ
jgi:hypothetical protein